MNDARAAAISGRPLRALLLLIVCTVAALTPTGAFASAITIDNIFEVAGGFSTAVDGSVSHLPPFFQIHNLVDIPGTPWVSSSRIVESAGLTADSVSVSWTMQHVLGPHDDDVNPNPNMPVTLNTSFTAAAPGGFSVPTVTRVVEHPRPAGEPHFDILNLVLFGEVTAGLLGHLDIASYRVGYLAFHCEVVDVTTGGCDIVFPPDPDPDDGGFAVPAPASLLLLGVGVLLALWPRRSARP